MTCLMEIVDNKSDFKSAHLIAIGKLSESHFMCWPCWVLSVSDWCTLEGSHETIATFASDFSLDLKVSGSGFTTHTHAASNIVVDARCIYLESN